jgi:hypothetical protein
VWSIGERLLAVVDLPQTGLRRGLRVVDGAVVPCLAMKVCDALANERGSDVTHSGDSVKAWMLYRRNLWALRTSSYAI